MSAQQPRIHSLAIASGRLLPQLAAMILAVLLAACASGVPERPAPAIEGPQTAAAAAYQEGDYVTAASAWESASHQAPPNEVPSLRVRAADAWLMAGNVAASERLLADVSRADLGAPDQSWLDLVLADLALRELRPGEADAMLRQAATNLPAAAQERYRALQSRTQRMLSGPMSRGLARAAQVQGDMRAYSPALAIELLRALEEVSSGELAIRAENPRADRQFVGWLDLALVIRQNLVIPDNIAPAVDQWKLRHPYHLLDESQALDCWLRYRQLFSPPRRTAVLLPDSGGLRSASEAIKDGLLSAYLDRPGGGELAFFSSGEDTQSTIAAYFSALDAGTTQIIGPLRKESVASLLQVPGLATPVLALNDLPVDFNPPPGLHGHLAGLSLSQEAEVAALAAQAAATGYRRAIVVAPESPWGERMATVFEAEFLHEDRQIVAATRYLESENDHSAVLERLLKIDESKARAQRLENVLQTTLEFEPTRREDVDVIFMAANPTQARLLRPQLRFLDAGDIPVYATGRVYSGQPDPGRNQDLDGIRFPTTRWELSHASDDDIPELNSLRNGVFGSLYALGQDAWNILSWLELMNKDPDFVFPGASGDYRMTTGGRLERGPAWAEFRAGRPEALSLSKQPARQRITAPSASARAASARAAPARAALASTPPPDQG
jgi:outer membrane PBP1 activator LpoA protein